MTKSRGRSNTQRVLDGGEPNNGQVLILTVGRSHCGIIRSTTNLPKLPCNHVEGAEAAVVLFLGVYRIREDDIFAVKASRNHSPDFIDAFTQTPNIGLVSDLGVLILNRPCNGVFFEQQDTFVCLSCRKFRQLAHKGGLRIRSGPGEPGWIRPVRNRPGSSGDVLIFLHPNIKGVAANVH